FLRQIAVVAALGYDYLADTAAERLVGPGHVAVSVEHQAGGGDGPGGPVVVVVEVAELRVEARLVVGDHHARQAVEPVALDRRRLEALAAGRLGLEDGRG